MRCPVCAADDDKVVDSRSVDDGAAIRRRRECLACGRRFTTFERIDELPLLVVKRSGDTEPFRREKLVSGLASAAKNRLTEVAIAAIVADVEEEIRIEGPEVTSQRIGVAVLDRLREADDVAYLRFASVYKGFDGVQDFEREVGELIKATEPKRHEPPEGQGPAGAEPPASPTT